MNVIVWVAVAPRESVALTTMPMNGLPVLVVGEPEMTPVVVLSVSPAGKAALPPASDQVYGPVPPAAVRWKSNGSETSPEAVAPEVTTRLLMTSVYACDGEVCGPTVTATEKLYVVAVVGLPEMTPLEVFNVSPEATGNEPEVIAKVGALPLPPMY